MNVLWIVADDLNDYIWAEEERTTDAPNLAQLAERSARFDACYVNSPLCCPSRVSFMVGKTPAWTGVQNNTYEKYFRKHFNGQPVVTLPEHFKANGYYTVGINKIYHNFQRSNFDNDFDYLQPNPLLRAGSWNQFYKQREGNLTPTDRDQLEGLGYAWGRLPEADEALLADQRAVNRAMQVLETFAENPAAFGNRPLMLAVGLISPHVPHQAPQRFFPEAYVPFIPAASTVNYLSPENPDGWPLPDYGPGGSAAVLGQLPPAAQAMAVHNAEHQTSFDQFALDNAALTSFSPEQLRLLRMANANMAYHAAIRYFDYEVGRLLQALDTLGLADNTLIVLHSDHGFSQGEHGHWAKNSLWETDLRVPLILYDPRQPVGQRLANPVSLIDLFPTLCDLAGLPRPVVAGDSSYLDGQSLVPLLQGAGQPRPVVSEINMNGDPRLGCGVSRSVLSDEWHYLELAWEPSGACFEDSISYVPLLYHLATDRLEWFNVADEPGNALVQAYLKGQLQQGNGAPVPAYTLQLVQEAAGSTGAVGGAGTGAVSGAGTGAVGGAGTGAVGGAVSIVSPDSVLWLGTRVRTAAGDSVGTLPPNLSIRWQVVLDDDVYAFHGASLSLDFNALPDSAWVGLDWIRVDAYLWDAVLRQIVSLDSQVFGLLHARQTDGSLGEGEEGSAWATAPSAELSAELSAAPSAELSAAPSAELGAAPPCVLSPDQQTRFFDLHGRLVEAPRPFQLYLDACGNKRMMLR
jgi:arylsulfatase A-like enzyme